LNKLLLQLKQKCVANPVLTIFMSMIVGINFIFHRPIQIINAVSLKIENDYSIHLSVFRELLEPIVGIPLFYLRAGEPVEEYIVLWIWIFLSFGLYLFLKKGFSFYKKWLLSIPAIIGLAYFILVWMIFWPIPSNKIINQSDSKILFNTHAHSYFSHDGLITPEEQMEWHTMNGFDAFFLTEHNHNPNTLDLVKQQRNRQLKQSPHIMAGIEFSGSNHMVLLGLTDSLITFGKKDSVIIAEVHRQGGIVGVAHWFDGQNKTIQHYIDSGVNGFEIVNKNQLAFPNKIHNDIINACNNNNLFFLGGADYHGYGPTCGTWNVLDVPNWDLLNHERKTEEILIGLKKRDNEVIVYSDRDTMPFDNIWISPLINIINYFRGLNIFQILSWIGWGIVLSFIRFRKKSKYILHWIPIISGTVIVMKARILIEKSIPVVQHNDVLLEFGDLFTLVGIGLIVSGISVWLLTKRFKSLV
jgi:hypothetical protein